MINCRLIRIVFVFTIIALAMQPVLARGSSNQPEVSPVLRPYLDKESIGEDTDSLLAALNHRSSTVRWIAAEEMGKRKVTAAIPQLQALLEDSNIVVRSSAAGALLEMGDRTGVPVLKALLDSDRKGDVIHAARALAAHGDDSGLDKVRPMLRSDDVGDRWDAITTLGVSHNPDEAYPALRQGVHDENGTARCMALNILERKATPEAVEIIAEMLGSLHRSDRSMALSVLIQLRRVEAIPHIIEALTDENERVRMSAATGITYLVGRNITPTTKQGVRKIEDARAVQAKWRQWWEENKQTFTLGPPTPPRYSEE